MVIYTLISFEKEEYLKLQAMKARYQTNHGRIKIAEFIKKLALKGWSEIFK